MNSHRCCKTAGIANVFVVILCAFHFLPCGASELMIFLQAEDKAELGQYEVHLMRNAKSISQSSDAKGTCRFRALSPGKYRIEVDSGDDSYANYYIAAKEINLGSEKKKVVIRLPMRQPAGVVDYDDLACTAAHMAGLPDTVLQLDEVRTLEAAGSLDPIGYKHNQ